MYAKIREFFAERDVLEVETPILSAATVTDRNLVPFVTRYSGPATPGDSVLFLQTSPEFAMKRLLATGVGSIFQICKAFRNGERGARHNPEFSMLEFYRVGFSLTELAAEVDELLFELVGKARGWPPSRYLYYADCFTLAVGVSPDASIADFAKQGAAHGYPEAALICGDDRNCWLDFLFSHLVQPSFPKHGFTFVFDFPACLPSLARAKPGSPGYVERVEVFSGSAELGNGFQELLDVDEQARRFATQLQDSEHASAAAYVQRKVDERLLAALAAGMPECSGIAIGLDRLLMALLGESEIANVLTFPLEFA